MKSKKNAVIAFVVFSLFVDGFCLGSFLNNPPAAKKKKMSKILPTTATEPELALAPAGGHKYLPRANPVVPPVVAKNQIVNQKRNPAQAPGAAPQLKPLLPPPIPEEPAPKESTAQYLAALESLEKKATDGTPELKQQMPTESSYEKVSPFLTWPKYQFEFGPGSGRENFQSTIGPNSVTNGNLVSNGGYFLRGQMQVVPRLVVEAKFQSTSGTESSSSNTVADSSFQTNEITAGARYRFLGNHANGTGYYFGLSGQRVSDYRYSYFGSSSGNIVNRPENFTLMKTSLGAELNSYYHFRGRLEVSYYFDMANSSQGNVPGYQFSLADGSFYSVDASISHIITGDMYVGLGVQYLYHAYNFTTNELGPTYQGSVVKSRIDAFLFLGVEL